MKVAFLGEWELFTISNVSESWKELCEDENSASAIALG